MPVTRWSVTIASSRRRGSDRAAGGSNDPVSAVIEERHDHEDELEETEERAAVEQADLPVVDVARATERRRDPQMEDEERSERYDAAQRVEPLQEPAAAVCGGGGVAAAIGIAAKLSRSPGRLPHLSAPSQRDDGVPPSAFERQIWASSPVRAWMRQHASSRGSSVPASSGHGATSAGEPGGGSLR